MRVCACARVRARVCHVCVRACVRISVQRAHVCTCAVGACVISLTREAHLLSTLHASQGFVTRNINCGIEESLKRFEEVCNAAKEDGVLVRGYVSCVVECPYDGPTEPETVAWVSERLLAMGCYEVSLGDTIGAGTPGSFSRMLESVLRSVDVNCVAVHCHDTYGQALANIYASLQV